MASTITAYANFQLNLLAPHTMGGGTPVGLPTVTPTKVTWVTTTGVFEVHGTGISFNPSTLSLDGSVNRVTYSENGVLLASADGLELTAAQVKKISEAPSMVEALVDILIADDNIFRLSDKNDFMEVGTGTDIMFGGGGVDTVILGHAWQGAVRANYTTTANADGSLIITGANNHLTLHDVERVMFSDGVLAFDTAGIAGQAYRLYQAAFDRTPDAGGLKFWVGTMDAGGSLNAAASSFITSSEFQSKYGSLSDAGFVDQLYQNVLGRSADKGGLDFWVAQLETQKLDRAGVLAGFSESGENVALVASAIDNGIWLG